MLNLTKDEDAGAFWNQMMIWAKSGDLPITPDFDLLVQRQLSLLQSQPAPAAEVKPQEPARDAVDAFFNRVPSIFLFSPTPEQTAFVNEFTLAKREWQSGGYKSRAEWYQYVRINHGQLNQINELQKTVNKLIDSGNLVSDELNKARMELATLCQQLRDKSAALVLADGQIESLRAELAKVNGSEHDARVELAGVKAKLGELAKTVRSWVDLANKNADQFNQAMAGSESEH